MDRRQAPRVYYSGQKGDYPPSNGVPGPWEQNRTSPAESYLLKQNQREIEVLQNHNKALSYKVNKLIKQTTDKKLMVRLEEIQELMVTRKKVAAHFLSTDEDDPVIIGEKLLHSALEVDEEEYKHSLNYLQGSLRKFQDVQKLLHQKEVEDMDEKVIERNSLRKELMSSSKLFLSKSGKGVYEDKLAEIKKVLKEVQGSPGSKLRSKVTWTDNTDKLLEEYKDWKTKKSEIFHKLHNDVDELKEKVKTLFWGITNFFVVDGASLPTTDSENLLFLLKTAIVDEIMFCNPVANRLRILVYKGLTKQVDKLSQIVQLRSYVTDLSQKISPWLNESPDTEQLITSRKEIKPYKSRVRRIRVDLLDAEDEEPVDKEKVSKIKAEDAELTETLKQMQEAQKKLLVNLETVCTEHFPEMRAKYPDFEWPASPVISLVGLDAKARSILHFKVKIEPEEEEEPAEEDSGNEIDKINEELKELDLDEEADTSEDITDLDSISDSKDDNQPNVRVTKDAKSGDVKAGT